MLQIVDYKQRKGESLKEGKFNERWEVLKEKQAREEAEMAARIRQLEMQQQGQQVGQPQVIIAQPQAAPAPAN